MWRYQSMMKDELIVGKHQVDGTRLLIYIYIFIHRCINFFAILVSQVRCYCNLYLLSFTKFLYEQYSNSRVLIHYIEGHYFIVLFVSIIGCHFIPCYINSFLYLQIQLYDTFSLSLSPSCALDIVL